MTGRGRGARIRKVDPPRPRRASQPPLSPTDIPGTEHVGPQTAPPSVGETHPLLTYIPLALKEMMVVLERLNNGESLDTVHVSGVCYQLCESGPQLDKLYSAMMEKTFATLRQLVVENDLLDGVRGKLLETLELRCRGWPQVGIAYCHDYGQQSCKEPAKHAVAPCQPVNSRHPDQTTPGLRRGRNKSWDCSSAITSTAPCDVTSTAPCDVTSTAPCDVLSSAALAVADNGEATSILDAEDSKKEPFINLSQKPCRDSSGIFLQEVLLRNRYLDRVLGADGLQLKWLQKQTDTRIIVEKPTEGSQLTKVSLKGPSENSIFQALDLLSGLAKANYTTYPPVAPSKPETSSRSQKPVNSINVQSSSDPRRRFSSKSFDTDHKLVIHGEVLTLYCQDMDLLKEAVEVLEAHFFSSSLQAATGPSTSGSAAKSLVTFESVKDDTAAAAAAEDDDDDVWEPPGKTASEAVQGKPLFPGRQLAKWTSTPATQNAVLKVNCKSWSISDVDSRSNSLLEPLGQLEVSKLELSNAVDMSEPCEPLRSSSRLSTHPTVSAGPSQNTSQLSTDDTQLCGHIGNSSGLTGELLTELGQPNTSSSRLSSNVNDSIDLQRLVQGEMDLDQTSHTEYSEVSTLASLSCASDHTPRKGDSSFYLTDIDPNEKLRVSILRPPLAAPAQSTAALAEFSVLSSMSSSRDTEAGSVSTRRHHFLNTMLQKQKQELQDGENSERLNYGRNFLLACAKSPVAQKQPKEWAELVKRFPEVCVMKVSSYYDPCSYSPPRHGALRTNQQRLVTRDLNIGERFQLKQVDRGGIGHTAVCTSGLTELDVSLL